MSIGCSLHWALQRCGGKDSAALYKAASEAFKGDKYLVSDLVLCWGQGGKARRTSVWLDQLVSCFVLFFSEVRDGEERGRCIW